MAVNNSLSPHGGELKVSVAPSGQAAHLAGGLPRLAVNEQIAREAINLAYGAFSPLNGFMGHADLDAVVRTMRLADGLVWSIPIVLDVSPAEWAATGAAPGGRILLTHQDQPLAMLDVSEVYSYDKAVMAQNVYGATDPEHPGVARTMALADTLVGGKVTLVNPPRINPPFDRFWKTPEQLRARLGELGWDSAVAHQTRNVPHAGHEMMMKGAYLASGRRRHLGQRRHRREEAGRLHRRSHRAVPRPAARGGLLPAGDSRNLDIDVGYALCRAARGCVPRHRSQEPWDARITCFGRDHAGVGSHYGRYAAHEVFDTLPELGIKSVLTLEWWYCPVCESVAYEGICGHRDRKQDLAGTLIRSIISGGEGPAATTLRPQVLEIVRDCAERYGMGSPFVSQDYLENRTPVIAMPEMTPCTCTVCQSA